MRKTAPAHAHRPRQTLTGEWRARRATRPGLLIAALLLTACASHPASVTAPQTACTAQDLGASVDIASKNANPPRYPPEASQEGLEGEAVLWVNVAADGNVMNISVQRSSGHPSLDQAAAKAARTWRYQPGRVGCKSAAGRVQIPVTFVMTP